MFQAHPGYKTADIHREWTAEEIVFVKAVISEREK